MSIAPHMCPRCKTRVWKFRGRWPADDFMLEDRLAEPDDSPPFRAHKAPGVWLTITPSLTNGAPATYQGMPVHPAHHCPPPHRCVWCGNKHQPTSTRNQTIIKEQP